MTDYLNIYILHVMNLTQNNMLMHNLVIVVCTKTLTIELNTQSKINRA